MPLYEKLILRNMSTLSLSLELCLVEPFALCETPGAHSSATNKVHVSHFLDPIVSAAVACHVPGGKNKVILMS